MKFIQDVVDEVQKRVRERVEAGDTEYLAKNSGHVAHTAMCFRLEAVRRCAAGDYITVNDEVTAAYRLGPAVGVDVAPLETAGRFFLDVPAIDPDTATFDKRITEEAGAFLAACFGHKDRGDGCYTPVMPCEGPGSAIRRLAMALDVAPTDLATKLSRASRLRKGAMFATGAAG